LQGPCSSHEAWPSCCRPSRKPIIGSASTMRRSKSGFAHRHLFSLRRRIKSWPALRDILDERVREADPRLVEKARSQSRAMLLVWALLSDSRRTTWRLQGFASIAAGSSTSRGDTSAECNAIPSRKKPFFHAYPGALAYSFGMLGCDLHCSYCQNWVTSQALRDPNAVFSAA